MGCFFSTSKSRRARLKGSTVSPHHRQDSEVPAPLRAALATLLSHQATSPAPSFRRVVLLFPALTAVFARLRSAFTKAAVEVVGGGDSTAAAFPSGIVLLSDAPAILTDLGFRLDDIDAARLFSWVHPTTTVKNKSTSPPTPRTLTGSSAMNLTIVARKESPRSSNGGGGNESASGESPRAFTNESAGGASASASSSVAAEVGVAYREFCLAMTVGAVLQLAKGVGGAVDTAQAQELVFALQLALTTWTLFDRNGDGELQLEEVVAIICASDGEKKSHHDSQSNSILLSKARWGEMAVTAKGKISTADFLLSLQSWVSDVGDDGEDEGSTASQNAKLNSHPPLASTSTFSKFRRHSLAISSGKLLLS